MNRNNWHDILNTLNILDANLLQVAVYGIHKTQQNCIIILEQDPVSFFDDMKPVAVYCRRRKLPIPLIITREFIRYSTDSYPLEFIDIMTDYQNLHVREDLLADLTISAHEVRLQMERELKSKWLHTRLAVMAYKTSHKRFAAVAKDSAVSILPVLKGFFHLRKQPIPVEPEALIQQADALTAFDMQPLYRVYTKPDKEINEDDLYAYIKMLNQLAKLMETWQL